MVSRRLRIGEACKDGLAADYANYADGRAMTLGSRRMNKLRAHPRNSRNPRLIHLYRLHRNFVPGITPAGEYKYGHFSGRRGRDCV